MPRLIHAADGMYLWSVLTASPTKHSLQTGDLLLFLNHQALC